jgi:hypothetical protein
MPATDRIKKTLTDTRPFYAVAGASDPAMEKLRPRLAALRGDLAPKALQHGVRDRVGKLRVDVRALPAKAADTYDHLAERGRTAVGRIDRPKPTEDFAEQAAKAVRGERATRTTAGKRAAAPAESTRSRHHPPRLASDLPAGPPPGEIVDRARTHTPRRRRPRGPPGSRGRAVGVGGSAPCPSAARTSARTVVPDREHRREVRRAATRPKVRAGVLAQGTPVWVDGRAEVGEVLTGTEEHRIERLQVDATP